MKTKYKIQITYKNLDNRLIEIDILSTNSGSLYVCIYKVKYNILYVTYVHINTFSYLI